jgi:hypothetical protein
VMSANEAGERVPVIAEIKSGQSFYIYLTDNSKPQGNWNVIPFGAGSVVVTSVGAQSNDDQALKIEATPANPIRSAGMFTFKLSDALKKLSAFTGKGLATLTAKGWEGRTLQAGQNIAVTYGDGDKGNPVIATKDDVGFKAASIDILTLKNLATAEIIKSTNIEKGAIYNAQIAPNSIKVDRFSSSGHAELIVGNDENYKFNTLVFPSDKVCVATRLPKSKTVSMETLPDLLNLDLNKEAVDGIILKPLSVASTALAQWKLFVPFATGVVQFNGADHQRYNCTFKRKETGVYHILFNQAASWPFYNVQVSINSNTPENPVAAFANNKTQTDFYIYIYNFEKKLSDAGFSFMVWDFIK